jgi:hypothetical protein
VKLLLDTNIFIPLEPTATEPGDPSTPQALRLSQLAGRAGAQLFLHGAQRKDIARDRDSPRRALREVQLSRYPTLTVTPPPSKRLEQLLARSPAGSNDWVDDMLIAALDADAVDYLVTQDERLHRKAARVGLDDKTIFYVGSAFRRSSSAATQRRGAPRLRTGCHGPDIRQPAYRLPRL